MKNSYIVWLLLLLSSCGMHRQSALGRHLFVAQKTEKIVDTNPVTQRDSNSCYANTVQDKSGATQTMTVIEQKNAQSSPTHARQSIVQQTQKSNFTSIVSALSPFPHAQRKRVKEIRIRVSQEKSLRWINDFPIISYVFAFLSALVYLIVLVLGFLVLIQSITGGLFVLLLLSLLGTALIFGVLGLVFSSLALKHIKYHSREKSSEEAKQFWHILRKRVLIAFIICIVFIGIAFYVALLISENYNFK